MCEATLGTSPSSSSPSSPSSSSNKTSAPPPFHTNPTKPGAVKSKLSLGLGLGKTKSKSGKSEGASNDGQEAEGYPESKLVSKPPSDCASESHPTSPGALISQPPKPQPSHNQNNPKSTSISQAHPDDIKKSLTTFEDPLGLGLETLPTTEHADKMAKKGERKIRLGSLLHSGKLVSQTCIGCSDGRISLTDGTFVVVLNLSLVAFYPFGRRCPNSNNKVRPYSSKPIWSDHTRSTCPLRKKG